MAIRKPNRVKPRKDLVKSIAAGAKQRAQSELDSRKTFLKTEAWTKLEEKIPPAFRWILPLLVAQPQGEELPAEEATVEPGGPILPTTVTSPYRPEPLYRQYHCTQGDPLSCDLPQGQAEPNYCTTCGFPGLLVADQELRGRRGRYRIDQFLWRRGLGRLYQGTLVADGAPVVIKEYLLPTRGFSAAEIQRRKAAFVQLAGINAIDGRVQDYRLVNPWDAIADHNLERCYLITKGKLDTAITLGTYLDYRGPMTALEVRHVLDQVLQTLEFLHGQKSRLPGGQVQAQGLPHGNLSLDSLLITDSSDALAQPATTNRPTFFIHACDLALWESLFELPTAIPNVPSPGQDLADLGIVAFYLLAGRVYDPDQEQRLDPKVDQNWGTTPSVLKQFILRLIGLDTTFETAAMARRALLQLPLDDFLGDAIAQREEDEETPLPAPNPLWWLYWLAGLGVLAWLLWWFFPRPTAEASASVDPLPCCINQVGGVPTGKFTYTAEASGSWNYVLEQTDLLSQGTTLGETLAQRQRKLTLSYFPVPTLEQVVQAVESGKRDFAIVSLPEGLGADLAQTEVAYDGLAVFVAFSYAKRDKSLPKLLQGEITLEQLQKLYTGQIKNWQQLGGPDLPVRLYVPTEAEAVRVFEQRVLKTAQNIAQFRALLPAPNPRNDTFIQTAEITRLPTFQTLRAVIQGFETENAGPNNQSGAIAFGTFSKVFGQCSVYPLALKSGEDRSVQALVQDNGKPINPETDLCRNKGSYQPQVDLFKTNRYPLAYPIAVLYPHDNSRTPAGAKFAETLRTQEGQLLLQQTGLVPYATRLPR